MEIALRQVCACIALLWVFAIQILLVIHENLILQDRFSKIEEYLDRKIQKKRKNKKKKL